MEKTKNIVGKTFVVEKLAERMDITLKDAENFVNNFLGLQEEILTDETIGGIQFIGMYSIKKKTLNERMGTNPRTKEPMLIPAKHSLKLEVGKKLKDALNK